MANRDTWSPPNSPHVVGTYDRRVWNAEEGKHEAQIVDMRCSICGDVYRVVCEQGRPREHVLSFGRAHFHGDPLEPVKR